MSFHLLCYTFILYTFILFIFIWLWAHQLLCTCVFPFLFNLAKLLSPLKTRHQGKWVQEVKLNEVWSWLGGVWIAGERLMGIKSSDNFPPPETFCTCASCFQCSEHHYCKGKKLLLCVLFKILVHLGYFCYQPKSSPSRWVANWHVPLKGRQWGFFWGPQPLRRCCFWTLVHPSHWTSSGLQSVQSS